MTPTEQVQLHPVLDRLFNRINYERQDAGPRGELKLDAIRQLVHELGNPEREYPIIHVAGTKGKGSVTAMCGAVLHAGGLCVGVYTSPHLEFLNQRFVINGKPVSDARLVQLLQTLWPFVDRNDQVNDAKGHRRLTFFDIATATAFRYFAEEQVDAAAIEVGLGGRLDSTNVCVPSVSVITSISYDHCRQLGDTLERIAGEKSGIIKPQIPVICGVSERIPRHTIQQIASERDAACFQIGKDYDVADVKQDAQGLLFDTSGSVLGRKYEFRQVRLPMFGRHQASNAATAIASLIALAQNRGMDLEPHIHSAFSKFRHPGRIEMVLDRPAVFLDVAHNVASIEALIQTLRELEFSRSFRRRIAIVAISRDKDQSAMLAQLAGYFDQLVFTRFVENPRATDPRTLLQMAMEIEADRPLPEFQLAETPTDAWQMILGTLQDDDLCVITGSVFLVAELRPRFREAQGS